MGFTPAQTRNAHGCLMDKHLIYHLQAQIVSIQVTVIEIQVFYLTSFSSTTLLSRLLHRLKSGLCRVGVEVYSDLIEQLGRNRTEFGETTRGTVRSTPASCAVVGSGGQPQCADPRSSRFYHTGGPCPCTGHRCWPRSCPGPWSAHPA